MLIIGGIMLSEERILFISGRTMHIIGGIMAIIQRIMLSEERIMLISR